MTKLWNYTKEVFIYFGYNFILSTNFRVKIQLIKDFNKFWMNKFQN